MSDKQNHNPHEKIEKNVGLMAVLIAVAVSFGGLAEIDSMKVGRTFSVANSRLPHNWVNALASFEGRLYIGTYGGGVAALMPSGEVVVSVRAVRE